MCGEDIYVEGKHGERVKKYNEDDADAYNENVFHANDIEESEEPPFDDTQCPDDYDDELTDEELNADEDDDLLNPER
jgi:hypothetical protein